MPKTLVKDGDEILSVPSEDRLLYRDSSHIYWLIVEGPMEIEPGDKLETLRLTSPSAVLKVINKPALIEAAVKLTRGGLDYRAEWAAAADRGTGVHAALQLYCETGAAPDLGDFEKAHHGFVSGLCSWLMEARPEPIATEFAVFHRELLYAGRPDLLARIDGEVHLVDLKTGKDPVPFAENFLQLAAYRDAMKSCGIEPLPDRLGVLKVCPDGRFRYVESPADVALFHSAFALNKGMKELERFLKPIWEEARAA